MASEAETRRCPRATITWPVILETSKGSVMGRTVDISASGAFICCREALQQHEEFNMLLSDFPPLNRYLPVSAKVMRSGIYCSEDVSMPHGIAVQFTRISRQNRKDVHDLVSSHLK